VTEEALETIRADRPRVSVVIPCLNEAPSIAQCVRRAREVLEAERVGTEVIVVDNGSDDDSAELARAAGAVVIEEPRRGYGSAYLAGFAAARGDYIVMVDADLTYDVREIPRFLQQLEGGAELVVGNRMANIEPGAMPWLNRYIGNPLLSGFLNLLYRTRIGDAHCGLRALRRDLLPRLGLHSTGMEFASEMVIRASQEGANVRELPIALHPRAGTSKLSPWRDGWRHLRLMLVYQPNFLFLLPGLVMLLAGVLSMLLVLTDVPLFGHRFFIHTLIGGSLLVVCGSQLIAFALCARVYALQHLGHPDRRLERLRGRVRLEHGLLLGGSIAIAGLALEGVIVGEWVARGLGDIYKQRQAIVAATLVIVGLQVFFTSFLLSILGLRRGGTQPQR
jgi:glycosyltransferase involved in cell wall biosynthesis